MSGDFPAALFGAVFLTGLLGGVHCVGMCGGIVAALSASRARQHTLRLHLAYSAGRILSYASAGALAGAVGSLSLLLTGLLPLQVVLYVAANLMLLALGLYLAGVSQIVNRMEAVGARLWKRIQPWARPLLPADTVPRALGLGSLWGWIPCGLVYSVLFSALFAGDALTGAAVMLAFGLGTLPSMLCAGWALRGLQRTVQARPLRVLSGAIVFAFGVYGLVRAATLAERIGGGLLCVQ